MRQLKAFNAKNTYDTLFFLAGFPAEMNCLQGRGKTTNNIAQTSSRGLIHAGNP